MFSFREIGPTEDQRISMDMAPTTIPAHDPTGGFPLSREDMARLDRATDSRSFREAVDHVSAVNGITFGTVHASYQARGDTNLLSLVLVPIALTLRLLDDVLSRIEQFTRPK